MCTYVRVCVYICMYVRAFLSVCMYIHVSMCTYLRTYIRVCLCVVLEPNVKEPMLMAHICCCPMSTNHLYTGGPLLPW